LCFEFVSDFEFRYSCFSDGAAVSDAYGFYLGQPWWLLASLVIVPMIWLAGRSLTTLGRGRRVMAILLRMAVVLLLATLLVSPAYADNAAPVTIVTSQTGSGFIDAGQAVWHGPDCPAPTGMSPEGGDNYTCPPAVKLPYPPPQRRPIPVRWP